MPKQVIMVVEDEDDILELIAYNLKKENYKVKGFQSGEEAITQAAGIKPDLMILDLMLPGLDGIEVCKFIKHHPELATTKVIILTAKGDESDIVSGLEIGADDYMTKPFSPKVLNARVKALLRRGSPEKTENSDVIMADEVFIHPGKREVKIDGKPVSLTNMEFQILHFLASHRGWAYSRSQIVGAVRGDNFAVTDRSVDTIIVGLRKKMGPASNLIETVRSVGYRFKD